ACRSSPWIVGCRSASPTCIRNSPPFLNFVTTAASADNNAVYDCIRAMKRTGAMPSPTSSNAADKEPRSVMHISAAMHSRITGPAPPPERKEYRCLLLALSRWGQTAAAARLDQCGLTVPKEVGQGWH